MLIYLVFILIISSFLYLFNKHRSNFTAANLPPGQIGWPLIGESIDLISASRKCSPQKFFSDRTAANTSEVFKTSLLGVPTAALCGAAGNKFVFSNEGKLLTTWWPRQIQKLFPLSDGTIETSMAASKKLRKIILSFLRPEALRRHVATMDAAAQRHFAAQWDGGDVVVASRLVRQFVFETAAKLFISVEEPEEVEMLLEHFTAVFDGITSVPVDVPGTTMNRALKEMRTVRKEIGKVISRRKAELEKENHNHNHNNNNNNNNNINNIDEDDEVYTDQVDILSHIMVTWRGMSDKEITDNIVSVFVGSSDTIGVTCISVVRYLAELPHVYAAVYKEQMKIAKSKTGGEPLSWEDLQKMKHTWNVVQEVLRLTSPAQGGFKEALTDITYGGFSIPKGWKLFWSITATHMNPAYFPKPDEFDPGRFEGTGPSPHTFIPFGGGPRMCPGREYARVKILVFLHNLVRRHRFEKVFPDEKNDGTFSGPMPAKGLPIRLFPHLEQPMDDSGDVHKSTSASVTLRRHI